MTYSKGYEENYAAILRRLSWLNEKPQGLLYFKPTTLHDIIIRKVGTQIHLVYVDPTANEIMSRIDIVNPLNLLAVYTQAMMLSLVWESNPSRVLVIGFGGGRIPMVFHHYFPNVIVESADIEPEITEISQKFFGIEFDNRLKIAIKDGRDYIADCDANIQYDCILVDAFRGTGYGPYRFSTLDFYNLCKRHLTDGGVVLLNLLENDQLYLNKILTFKSAFVNTYLFRSQGVNVLIGTIGKKIEIHDICKRAEEIQEKFQFPFPFIDRAHELIDENDFGSYLPDLAHAQILTDNNPPDGYFDSISPQSTIFKKTRRNEICPCGSGKKFKDCHGHKNSIFVEICRKMKNMVIKDSLK